MHIIRHRGTRSDSRESVVKSLIGIDDFFLAPLSTTCSRGAFMVVWCPSSSTISLNIFPSQTAGPIWTKLTGWECFLGGPENCSQNLIPSKILVAMATKWNFSSNSLKIFSSGTACSILK